MLDIGKDLIKLQELCNINWKCISYRWNIRAIGFLPLRPEQNGPLHFFRHFQINLLEGMFVSRFQFLRNLIPIHKSQHNTPTPNWRQALPKTNYDPAHWCIYHIDGLVQERRNSIANAQELRLSCTNSFICQTCVSRAQWVMDSFWSNWNGP